MSDWNLGMWLGFFITGFVTNFWWLLVYSRNHRAWQEHDSVCCQISRDSRVEIDRLRYLVEAHQDTICSHKKTIAYLEILRDKNAKQILRLEESLSESQAVISIRNETIEGLISKITGLENSHIVKCEELNTMNRKAEEDQSERDRFLQI